MNRYFICCISLLFATASAHAEAPAAKGDKLISGMSIVGNDEAPKSLVIVPWKSSALGGVLEFSKGLADGRQAVDKDVFLRELSYYQIKAGPPGVRVSASK
jgi:hypothetical protein